MGYALVLVSLFTLIVIGSLLVARDALLSDYPPAIRERYGEQTAGPRLVAVLYRAASPGYGAAVGGLGVWLAESMTVRSALAAFGVSRAGSRQGGGASCVIRSVRSTRPVRSSWLPAADFGMSVREWLDPLKAH